MDKIELLGSACFSHGPYTFYKAVRIGNGRVLRLGSFFLTKLWSDTDLVSIGELQLLWIDNRGSNQPLASLRLYFLPENTPDGRRDIHGEDEVLTISEKVVVHVHDLVTWLSPSLEWTWGRQVKPSMPVPSTNLSPSSPPATVKSEEPTTEKEVEQILSTCSTTTTTTTGDTPPVASSPTPPSDDVKLDDIKLESLCQTLTDPGIDFSDVNKQQKDFENSLLNSDIKNYEDEQTKVVVLSYPRYCRYRALLRRLEGVEPNWLSSSMAAALGGFTAFPSTRVLFCRDTFDYPDLETHELLCNHLAPKLKGRPRRKRKKRSVSPGESSNESEASVTSTSRTCINNFSTLKPPVMKKNERKVIGEEKQFLEDVQSFMSSRGTPVGKMPLLGYRQIDLYLFYKEVKKLGGYDNVSAGRLWKSIYDEIGGNTGSTSAATITRRHYERLLLPYERYQRGEETKIRPCGRRSKSLSETESEDRKSDENIKNRSIEKMLSVSIMASDKNADKPKTEVKASSLRSVRVKSDRLKSLTTENNSPPSPPTSSNGSTLLSSSSSSSISSSSSSSLNNTPSTTPTGSQPQNVLEQQINSPMIISPSSTPPVNNNNNTAPIIVALTPPPEKDMKDIKLLDSKQTNLMAQGKENIPLFIEKSTIFTDKIIQPKSPEIIDLEMECDNSKDKIIIPSFKKRKLEILREGGLEVTPVDPESRPSVIQATITPVSHYKNDDKLLNLPTSMNNNSNYHNHIVNQPSVITAPPPPPPPPSSAAAAAAVTTPKLISLTVTPDITHMLSSPQDNNQRIKQSNNNHHRQSHSILNNNSNNSKVINLDSSSPSSVIQLYSNSTAGISPTSPNGSAFIPSSSNNDNRIIPPKVTQSRSIFAHNEKTIYGDPKHILASQKQQSITPPIVTPSATPPLSVITSATSGNGILDLTAKQNENSPANFARPNLEIVRVPVVTRASAINLGGIKNNKEEIKRSGSEKNQFNYPTMLDSRTMTSNNLEITLVNPKNKPPVQPIPISNSISRHQNGITSMNNHLGMSQSRTHTSKSSHHHHHHNHHHQANGKYSHRSMDLGSPYSTSSSSPRKMNQHPTLISNISSANHNSNHSSSNSNSGYSVRNIPQQLSPSVLGDKRVPSDLNHHHHHQQQQQQLQHHSAIQHTSSHHHSHHSQSHSRHHHHHHHHQKNHSSHSRRISEGNSSSSSNSNNNNNGSSSSNSNNLSSSHQSVIQPKISNNQNNRHGDNRRHSVPNIPSGFMSTVPHGNPFLSQLPNNTGKYLPPMIDPVYYSAIYNGLFPPPMPSAAVPPSYLSPSELSAYYKDFINQQQQQHQRINMGQHPASK